MNGRQYLARSARIATAAWLMSLGVDHVSPADFEVTYDGGHLRLGYRLFEDRVLYVGVTAGPGGEGVCVAEVWVSAAGPQRGREASVAAPELRADLRDTLGRLGFGAAAVESRHDG